MIRFYLLIALLFTGFYLKAQEMNFKVSINTPQLQLVDPKVFQELEDAMTNFLNNQKWTDDAFEPTERIECNIQLNIREELSATSFTADLQIQALRPIFGSSEKTILLSHNDKDIAFTYEQFQPLEYSKNVYRDNLTAVLSFYVYVTLGLDYDSFSAFGGDPYFQIAQDIVTEVPPTEKSRYKGWQSLDGNRNRYWIIENLLSPRVRPMRQALYDYHRQSLDIMAVDVVKGRNIMMQSLEAISGVNKAYPNSMFVQMFANAKSNEIIEIFKEGDYDQKNKVTQIMTKIDAAGASRYRQIGK